MIRNLTNATLTRSNLRDLILFLSFVSAIFSRVTGVTMAVGFLLLLVGCFIHLITKGILIRNVVLCDGGVYGIVRHPYYLSNYLVDSGFCVLSGNAYLLLLYPFMFFWAYGPTMRKEEAYLSSRHADAFGQHSVEIPQVFPDRASLGRWKSFFRGFSGARITWNECSRIARIGSMGLFITLVHDTRAEGLTALFDMIRPTFRDYDEFLLAITALMLYATSFLFVRLNKSKKP